MTKTVLIVDDSNFMRTLLKDMLEKSKFNVVTEAKDGYEAIKKYKEFSPDIVLLDMTMPRLNGLGALKEIKKYDSNATVIMCSALGTRYLVMEALNNGAKGFIIKPHFDRLISTLENVV